MINNYEAIVPQLTITEVVAATPNALSDRLVTLIVGPQFALAKYDADAPANGVAYVPAGVTVPFTGFEAGWVPDGTFTRLFGSKLELKLSDDADLVSHVTGAATLERIQIEVGAWAGTGRAASLTRDVQVGDIVYTNDSLVPATKYRRRVTALAKSSGAVAGFDVLVLDGPALSITAATPTALDVEVEVRQLYTGEILPKAASDATLNFTTGTNPTTGGVVVRAGLEVQIGATWLAVEAGTVYTSTRALVPPVAGEANIGVDASNIDVLLPGNTDQDSELGYGANRALSGSQGKRIFILRTDGTDAAAFAAALKKVSSTNTFSFIGVVSGDLEVIRTVQAHVDLMQQPKVMNFRVAYTGVDSPAAYNFASGNATLSLGVGDVMSRFRDESASFTGLGIEAGDLVQFNVDVDAWGDPVYTQLQVVAVVSDTELQLAAARDPLPTVAVTVAVPYNLTKPDGSVSGAKAFLKAAATTINDRLVRLLWTDLPNTIDSAGNVVKQKMRFVACEFAGLRSAVQPHQGFTKTECTSITSAPTMFTKFDDDDLNFIASYGVFVITQETVDGPVFVRHQLTTATTHGALYYEDSVTTNLHDLSFLARDTFEFGYIGKKNATPQVAVQAMNAWRTRLLAKSSTVLNPDLGPQILEFRNRAGAASSVDVILDPVLKDRFNCFVQYEIPLPLNRIAVIEEATTITATGAVVSQTTTIVG